MEDQDAHTDPAQPSVLGGVAALADSPRLRKRRFDSIPLRGPSAPTAHVQGRRPGESTTPAELSDLISSIATVGVLQPVLAEEIEQGHGPPRLQLVTGERRLRACRWGSVNLPQNPHFASLPAIICPGPLSESERRIWQIVENLAREPLRPGEQAAALLFHRCAVLTGKLLRAGKPVPAQVYAIEDPTRRWEALERIRGQDNDCAAPWSEVLNRLGLQLSPRKARELVSAFKALPQHISEEMDEARIRVHTRIRFARLLAGRAEAAHQIWAAVKEHRQTALLPAAVQAALDHPALPAESALQSAKRLREEADKARSAALARSCAGLPPELVRAHRNSAPEPADPAPPPPAAAEAEPEPDEATAPSTGHDPINAAPALEALRDLTGRLRAGGTLDRYAHGSLRLLLEELGPLLEEAAST